MDARCISLSGVQDTGPVTWEQILPPWQGDSPTRSNLLTKQLGADSQFKMESGFLACFSTFRNATCTYLNQPSWLHKLFLQNTGSPAELIRIIGLFEVKLKTTYAGTRELHSRIWFYWVLIYGLIWNGVFQKQAPKCKLSCFQRGGEACDC